MTAMDHQVRWWWYSGKYYGFPECCIRAFLRLEHMGQPKRKFDGTGFVPCQTCNDSKTEEQLIAEINSNRVFKEPFPSPGLQSRDDAEKWADEQEAKRDPRYIMPPRMTL